MYGSECVDHYVVSAVSEERNSTSFLIIESRDCITSPENYSIVVTITNIDTELEQTVNISFNTKVYYDLEDELTPHLIRVSVVHSASSIVVDEWNPVIMHTPPTQHTESGFYDNHLVCVCVCVLMC